jgi:hypothetical protein
MSNLLSLSVYYVPVFYMFDDSEDYETVKMFP